MEDQALEEGPLGRFADEFGYQDSNDWLLHALLYGSDTNFIRLQTVTEYHLLAQNRYNELIDQIFIKKNIANKDAFRQLITILAQSVSKAIHIRRVAQSLQLNFHTTQRYIAILEEYNVVFAVKGYHNKRGDELHIYSKYYFTEQSLLTYILNIHKIDNLTVARANTLWKNLCISEKRRACLDNINKGKLTLYYWQTHDKLRYDLVIHDKLHRKTTAYDLDFRQNSLARKAPIGQFPIKAINPLSLWGKTYPKHRTFQVTPHSILTFLK